MPDQWRWNQVPSYRLSESDVKEYLEDKFGDHDFSIEVM